MALIALSRGFTTLVSGCDLDWLREFMWTADVRIRPCGHEEVYAARWVRLPDGRQRKIYMHRAIVRPPNDLVVDHKNGDTLDNRRSNLRLATCYQNRYNMNGLGVSRFIGVSPDRGRWRARITRTNDDGRREYLFSKYCKTEEEAARAYDEAAKEIFGEFARLNFPEPEPECEKHEIPF